MQESAYAGPPCFRQRLGSGLGSGYRARTVGIRASGRMSSDQAQARSRGEAGARAWRGAPAHRGRARRRRHTRPRCVWACARARGRL
eukprot:scaffold4295_cov38-Phaeocystis_antarctica.AAC.1